MGKVAVVTGAGGGIGRQIARSMAAAGACVVVNDLGVSLSGDASPSNQGASETQLLIEDAGGRAIVSTDSVSSWETAHKIIDCAIDAFGRVDIVVNNAGIMRDVAFEEITAFDWKAVIDVHLNGSFFVSRAAAPHFVRQNSGAYIHLTSTAGLIGAYNRAAYSAAKLGVATLSKSIAMDMQKYGVRSNCIAPFAWSRMTASLFEDGAKGAAGAAELQLRKMTAETNAPLAVYLGSDLARDVSGQIFAVRLSELFVFNQHRPVRSVHHDGGWSVETIESHAMPALRRSFTGLETTSDVFSWDPV